MKLWMMLPAGLTGGFVGAAILAAFDHDWVAMTVLAVLAIPAGVAALRVKKRVDNA